MGRRGRDLWILTCRAAGPYELMSLTLSSASAKPNQLPGRAAETVDGRRSGTRTDAIAVMRPVRFISKLLCCPTWTAVGVERCGRFFKLRDVVARKVAGLLGERDVSMRV